MNQCHDKRAYAQVCVLSDHNRTPTLVATTMGPALIDPPGCQPGTWSDPPLAQEYNRHNKKKNVVQRPFAAIV